MQVMSNLDLAILSLPECHDSECVCRARISLDHDLGCPLDPWAGIFRFLQGRTEPDGGQNDPRNHSRPVIDIQPAKVHKPGLPHGRRPPPQPSSSPYRIVETTQYRDGN